MLFFIQKIYEKTKIAKVKVEIKINTSKKLGGNSIPLILSQLRSLIFLFCQCSQYVDIKKVLKIDIKIKLCNTF